MFFSFSLILTLLFLFTYKITYTNPVLNPKHKKKHSTSACIRIGAGEENRTLTVSLEG